MSVGKRKSRLILPEAEAGSTGFRRFPMHSRSILLEDIQIYLDPVPGQEPEEPDAAEWGGTQREALARLDALAMRLHAEGKILPLDRMPAMDSSAEFALAVDKYDCSPAVRFRAIVSRAFARGDFVAGAIAQRYELLRDVGRCHAELGRLLTRQNKFSWELIEAGADLLSILEKGQKRDPMENAPQSLVRAGAEDPDALRMLDTRFDDALAELPDGGRTPEHARNFFALRLTEMAVAATGIAPAYSDTKIAAENPVKEILKHGLSIVGLDGRRSLDETLRKFNSDSVRLKREGHYVHVEGLSGSDYVPYLGGDLEFSKFPFRKRLEKLGEVFPVREQRSFYGEYFGSELYVAALFGDALVGYEPPESRSEAYQHITFAPGDWLSA